MVDQRKLKYALSVIRSLTLMQMMIVTIGKVSIHYVHIALNFTDFTDKKNIVLFNIIYFLKIIIKYL